jgi:hypothetical protein
MHQEFDAVLSNDSNSMRFRGVIVTFEFCNNQKIVDRLAATNRVKD